MIPIPDTTEIVKQTQSAASRAHEMVVASPATMTEAGDFLRVVKTIRKRIGDTFDGPIKAAHAAHKSVLAAKAEHDKPLADAERIVKGKVGAYQQEEERKRQAEERRLREIARKQEEERRLAEAQQLEDEAIAKRVEAEQAAADGQTVTAEIRRDEAAKLDHAIDATLMTPIPESVLVIPTNIPKVEGVQTKQLWKHRVVNAGLIPREWLIPDDRTLAAIARTSQGRRSIPGVEFYSEASVAVSGYGR